MTLSEITRQRMPCPWNEFQIKDRLKMVRPTVGSSVSSTASIRRLLRSRREHSTFSTDFGESV